MTAPRSPIPETVSRECERARLRWHQLPQERALAALGPVHALLAELAGRPVPDLGPRAVPDQLQVVVYDWCAAGHADDEGRRADLVGRLASLRLGWSAP